MARGRESGRFEFGWLGILGMFTIFTAGSVVIFFLGIYVGKGLQESRLAREERVVRLPVNPGETGNEYADVRSHDTSDEPRPAQTTSVNLAVRVQPVATPSPEPVPVPTAELAAVEPEPTAAIAALPVATPASAPRTQAEPPAQAVRPAPSPAVALARPTPAVETVAKAEPAARPTTGKYWSVQVNATKDQETADRLVQRLNELGYQAFIVRVRLADETWYRVRVGKFPTMEAATAVVMRLKNEERYSRAFLVNE
ncbi:MAG TPA: SPOR domain-containing protein [Candidatus Binatia bacterium]